MSILSVIPEGVARVMARSLGDPYGIAENALEGAVSGGAIGALTHRLYGDKKKVIDKESITSGAKLGALHGAIGKIISRIPGEAVLEDRLSSRSPLAKLFGSESSRFWNDIGAHSDAHRTHKAMSGAEKVVRNVYTFNRMKTAIKEQMRAGKHIPKVQHNIKAIK
jgi:hypothetical protein